MKNVMMKLVKAIWALMFVVFMYLMGWYGVTILAVAFVLGVILRLINSGTPNYSGHINAMKNKEYYSNKNKQTKIKG